MTGQNNSTTAILMGTYNGARFIREQLASLAAQDHTDWCLLIRDDGSSDETVTIIAQAASSDPRIEIIRDNNGNLGPAQNFSTLCHAAKQREFEYIFFADQDDIWHPNKIGKSLSVLKTAEHRSGPATPLLIHTDLRVVDENRALLDPSSMHYNGFHHVATDPLRTLLVQNFVTGCSSAFNRALLTLAAPIPPVAIMHDYWFALCAATFGRLLYLPHATLEYRQHGRNQVGAKRHTTIPDTTGRGVIRAWREGIALFEQRIAQARALQALSRNRSFSTRDAEVTLQAFLNIFQARNRAARLARAVRTAVRSQRGAAYDALMFAQILFCNPEPW